jgi:hypothetical protein
MLLVILGAGASYDSVAHLRPPNEVFPSRPPLADELFADRPNFNEFVKTFPECKPVIPPLRTLRPGISVEQILYRLQEESGDNPKRPLQMIAIRFYLQGILRDCERRWTGIHHGITNHATLLDEIEQWRCRTNEETYFVTFNYDTMLEVALIEGGFLQQPQQISDYIGGTYYRIFKLHGSVDWGRAVEGVIQKPSTQAYQLFLNNIRTLTIRPDFRLYNQQQSGSIPLFPAIAIPVEQKTTFECPQSHIDSLHTCLEKVSKIVTIGWRATERHFLACLEAHLLRRVGNALVVSGNSAETQTTKQNIISGVPKLGRTWDWKLAQGGFSDLVTSGLLPGFLNK